MNEFEEKVNALYEEYRVELSLGSEEDPPEYTIDYNSLIGLRCIDRPLCFLPLTERGINK
jgi:hypothetical protein